MVIWSFFNFQALKFANLSVLADILNNIKGFVKTLGKEVTSISHVKATSFGFLMPFFHFININILKCFFSSHGSAPVT